MEFITLQMFFDQNIMIICFISGLAVSNYIFAVLCMRALDNWNWKYVLALNQYSKQWLTQGHASCTIAELIYSVFDFWFCPPALASQGIDLLSASILIFIHFSSGLHTLSVHTKPFLFYLPNIPFFHPHGYILLQLLPFLTLTNALWPACLLSPVNHPPLCCKD